MILSHTVEYALRAMACLATNDNGPIAAATLAEAANVPLPYLSKVMRKMVVAGLVTAQKGHRGGFRLARKPEEILVADVLRAAGASLRDGHCAFGWDPCSKANPCPLHPLWAELNHRLDGWMTQNTLANVLKRAPEAVQLRRKK